MPVQQPLNVFSLSEIENAFRLIQSGKHIGNVILKAELCQDQYRVKSCRCID